MRKTAIYGGTTFRDGDLDGFAKEMAGYAGLGVETIIVPAPGAEPVQWIEERAAPAARMLAGLR